VNKALEKFNRVARGRFGGKLWSILGPEWQLRSGLKVKVASWAEWVTYNDIFVDGEYDVPIQHAIAHAASDAVILDVGANVGYFALRLSDLWIRNRPDGSFRLIGVEGSPHVFPTLRERLRQNPLDGKTHYHFGLAGKRSGQARISSSEFHVTNSIVTGDGAHGESVPFLDVSTLVAAGTPIALLKCDIEGAEQMFIENYPDLLRRTDSAVFEFQHDICDSDRCVGLLKEAGLSHAQQLRELGSTTVDFFIRD
jgi:FkbM family methyltransferase